ncbi:MAG: hypothetical protein ILNGONEN_00818 [Syntrophorhabdaceae bacterium]|nr:hypothetical protein [Syntrophorhabdaceae bacterium]
MAYDNILALGITDYMLELLRPWIQSFPLLETFLRTPPRHNFLLIDTSKISISGKFLQKSFHIWKQRLYMETWRGTGAVR